MLPRETLTQPWALDEIRRYPAERFGAIASGGADPRLVAALADAAARGRKSRCSSPPMAAATRAPRDDRGRSRSSPASPCSKADLEQYRPHEPVLRRLRAGQGAAGGRRRHAGRCRRAVVPARVQPNEQTFWAHIDVDVLKARLPDVDLPRQPAAARATAVASSNELLAELRAKPTPRLAARRSAALEAAGGGGRSAARAGGQASGRSGPAPGEINPHYLCAALAKALTPRTSC